MTAQDRGWGPGFPVNRSKDMKLVDAGGVRVNVHKDLAPLVAWLLEETARRGYKLRRGECWGYANRPIKGGSAPSNHSWGLAVDLNAPANPQTDRLVTDMPVWMPALWKAWGFRWGGDYQPPTKKDAMHYEYVGTPDDLRRHLARLKAVQGEAAKQPAPPKMEVVPMYNPPIPIGAPVVATLPAPQGGVWMLTEDGAVYAWHCPDKGAPNRHPDYWGSRRAARLEPLGEGFRVVASSGEFYDYP